MNILFIIGNGLDVSLGMKTDYQSFYDYYEGLDLDDPDILKMRQSIKDGRYKTWADLESGLGNYTKSLYNKSVFLKCLNHLKGCLKEYLKAEFTKRKYTISSITFKQDLNNPESYLDPQVYERFLSFLRSLPPQSQQVKSIRIVTFNYTETIDEIVKPYQLLHLHGSLKDVLVMGVNDDDQIANPLFKNCIDIEEEFVKPFFNDSCLNNNNATFARMINESNVIVLFGTSVGETDRKWWQLIGNNLLSSRLIVLYFVFDKTKDTVSYRNKLRRWSEEYQKILLDKLRIPEEKRESVLPRVCVGINKTIFKGVLKTPIPAK